MEIYYIGCSPTYSSLLNADHLQQAGLNNLQSNVED